ncbi:MAG: Gfo/Idh/MocA family oxidoreductase [Flavobacteriales bacterium]|nr:Gfo/Idh/MocA family oxidoreductase [Flavobacteriales bacterium]
MRIGVLGAGHLGKIHIRLLKDLEMFDLVGFFDPDQEMSLKASHDLGVRSFATMDELIDRCEVIDIVTPTLSHLDCAIRSLNKGKHIFIEKPISDTVEGALQIRDLAHQNDLKVQVGHVERFNPAFVAVKKEITDPMFIESHRLAQFNPRGTDVSVVLDLMIHDIDAVLSVVNSNVRDIKASGVSVLSDTPDICNARVEFENGCVANFTASRISMKNMRKTRFFQQNAYISVDYLEKKSEVVKMKDVEGEIDPLSMTIDLGKDKVPKEIYFDQPDIKPTNAIQEELRSFYFAIKENKRPIVSVEDGCDALSLALNIINKLDLSLSV